MHLKNFILEEYMRLGKLLGLLLVGFTFACCTAKSRIGEGNVPLAEAEQVLKDINFAFDKADLDATAKQNLKFNAEYLAQNSGLKVQIEGHCDERGTNEYNMALGSKRAQTAYDFMKASGIDTSRMSTVSYGEELPLNPDHNEAAWSKNRRAHFKAVQ